MATRKSQRIAIWVIAVALTVGTIGSFLVMALASQNEKRDQAELQKAYTEYQQKVEQRDSKLSDKYYSSFKKYEKIPAKFDAKSVKKLTTKTLQKSDGKSVGEDESQTVYYIGWTSDGNVFDSSFGDGKLKAPFEVTPGGVIEGWEEGLKGMKPGEVREITIPADKAYGEQAQQGIPANSPLKFIVMAIPQPEEVPIPKILLQQSY